jgi:hypothetical protein
VHGHFTAKITSSVCEKALKQACYLYFDCHVGDNNENWAQHICCVSCYINLNGWKQRRTGHLLFPLCSMDQPAMLKTAIYVLWKSHVLLEAVKIEQYSNILSAMKLVPHKDDLTPVPQTNWKKLTVIKKRTVMIGLYYSLPSYVPDWQRITLNWAEEG